MVHHKDCLAEICSNMSLELCIFIGLWVIAVIIVGLSRATKKRDGYEDDYYDDWDLGDD